MRWIAAAMPLLLLGCGPSEEEKAACASKKAAAREAWGACAKVLQAESSRSRADLVKRAEAAKIRAVTEGLAGQDADVATKAAQKAKAASRIAAADAFRTYRRAVDTAAGAAENLEGAWGGTAFGAIEAEASAVSQLDPVGPAAERLAAVSPEDAPSVVSEIRRLRSAAQEAGVAALSACEKLERE